MSELTLSDQLATFAVSCREDGVPKDVSRSVEQRILDVLGLSLAAHRLPTSRSALDYVLDQGGSEQASLIGAGGKATAAHAAFFNGVLAHSLDYDDTHLPSVLHPSASVVPAALAVAEHVDASGAAVVNAIAAGIETTIRLGMAGYDKELGNSVFFEHGQHATSICGAMGSALTAGILYGLNHEQLRDCLGVAASMAAGVIEANRTGGTVKRIHCGWAAQSGVVAAQLVRHGISGPPTVLEGRFGFFQAWLHGQFHPEEISTALGEEWAVPGIFFKPYPANHFTHTAIDAGRAAAEAGIKLDDIRKMTLAVPSAVIRTIGQPLEQKQRPESGYQAQFSGPYAVAAGLIGGGGLGVWLDDFTDELAQDPQRRHLMSMVDVVSDPRCDEIFPYQFPAILTIETDDGEHVFEFLTNRGGPERPLSDEEIAGKFNQNAEGMLASDVADGLSKLALELSQQPGVTELMTLARGATKPNK